MDPYTGCHTFHFFGGFLILLLGIMIGKAILWRRMMRHWAPPWAHGPMGYYGGCGGPRHWPGPGNYRPGCGSGTGQAPAQSAAPAPAPAPAPGAAPAPAPDAGEDKRE